eukprot:12422770-Karenia_brevis.AAC.1
MAAFVPLSRQVLGSKALGWNRRVNLAWSMVMSRLFFGVHVWFNFSGKPHATVNGMYMREWRRIVGDPRYQRTRWSDEEVRELLQVSSLDCSVRRWRLMYMSRLARA